MTKEQRREYDRLRYQRRAKEISEQNKVRYANDPEYREKMKEKARIYNEVNKEEIKDKKKAYYNKNIKKFEEYYQEYYKEKSEQINKRRKENRRKEKVIVQNI